MKPNHWAEHGQTGKRRTLTALMRVLQALGRMQLFFPYADLSRLTLKFSSTAESIGSQNENIGYGWSWLPRLTPM